MKKASTPFTAHPRSGMRTFVIIWLGQFVSLVGTAMGQFALTIWVWQETGQATSLALMAFFSFAPVVLLSPLAGAVVDRMNRKLVMMLSDLGAGLASIVLVILLTNDSLLLWHLYALAVWTSAFSAFQFPAYSAAISAMLPKEQYTRASGMLSIAESGSGIAAPILAGALLAFIGIRGVLLLDIISFVIALLTLALLHIPAPPVEDGDDGDGSSFWQDTLFGFQYIFKHKPLFAVQMVFFAANLLSSFSFFMIPALILARTGSNEMTLASVQLAMGLGGVCGGVLLTWWGGPRRKIHGVLVSMALSALLGSIVMGVGRQLLAWLAAGFMTMAAIAVMNGANQALWQSKVPLSLQGRVFAARRLLAQLSGPPALIAAGLLADKFFEPAMQPTGLLADSLGWLVGVGAGAGIGLMCVLTGLLELSVIAIAYNIPSITKVDTLLPDNDETP